MDHTKKFHTLTSYFSYTHSTLNRVRQSSGTSIKWSLSLRCLEQKFALLYNFPACHQFHSSSFHSLTVRQHRFLTMQWHLALITLSPSDSHNVPLSRIITKEKVIVTISPKWEEIFWQKTQVTTVNL
jgi:hypothetical protein